MSIVLMRVTTGRTCWLSWWTRVLWQLQSAPGSHQQHTLLSLQPAGLSVLWQPLWKTNRQKAKGGFTHRIFWKLYPVFTKATCSQHFVSIKSCQISLADIKYLTKVLSYHLSPEAIEKSSQSVYCHMQVSMYNEILPLPSSLNVIYKETWGIKN